MQTLSKINPGVLVSSGVLLQRMNYPQPFLNNNIYLLNYVSTARWASGQLVDADNTTNNTALSWMGSDSDSNGFVRLDNAVVMEDKQTYRALRTHPKWVNNGTIKGWLPWVQLNGTGTFKASVGFLNGALGTDGVTFQVWVHFHIGGVEKWVPAIQQHKNYTGQLQEISADLSKWPNQAISIELRVDAGPSSGKDWAAWINPRIEIAVPVVQTPGPVITSDNPPFFNDRYDTNKKWYLPDFQIKQPIKDSFMFSCTLNAQLDAGGKQRYNGEISFIIVKNIPAAIASLPSDPKVTYNEIPINNLAISYVDQSISQSINYNGTIAQNGIEYTLTLKPGSQLEPDKQEQYLEALFNFITDRNNAAFSKILITGTYMGYILKAASPQFQDYQDSLRLNHIQLLKVAVPLKTPPPIIAPHPQMFIRGKTIAAAPVSGMAATASPSVNIINPPTVDYTNSPALLFSKNIGNVNYPCSGADGFPNNFIKKDSNGANPIAFNCQLPFGDNTLNKHVFTEFFPKNAILTNYGLSNIYLNNRNFTYLIIPAQYVIMLEDPTNSNPGDQLVPAAYLNTVVDDSNADNCTANFKFHIAPNISSFQLSHIKNLIFSNSLPGVYQTPDDVIIDFPEKISDSKPLVFDKVKGVLITALGAYDFGVPGSNYFQLELQGVSIGDASAATIAATIKGQMGNAAIVNNIFFEIDSDTETLPQSSIVLGLNTITGNGLGIEKNNVDNQIYLLNQTLYDINIKAIAPKDDSVAVPLSNSNSLFVIKNSTAANVADNIQSSDINADNYLSILPYYAYVPNKDYFNTVLNEIRIDAQKNISDSIIVTNNTGLFGLYNINRIDVTIYILSADETDFSKAFDTIPISIIKDGSINNVPFTLPIGNYISKWSVVYSTNLTFSDGTTQQNNVQVIKDINSIGKVINLTVANLNLSNAINSNKQ